MPLPAEKGLKLSLGITAGATIADLMPLPAEKGLKLVNSPTQITATTGFDAPSSRKRIETSWFGIVIVVFRDLMPLPAEKGLKPLTPDFGVTVQQDLMPLPAEKGLKRTYH